MFVNSGAVVRGAIISSISHFFHLLEECMGIKAGQKCMSNEFKMTSVDGWNGMEENS